ncbi:MAG TPA: dihydrofolate reductase family protein [Solirubrobacteraceae bacterium]
MTLRRLLPSAGALTADELVSSLDFAALAPDDRPYVAVNMVATVDGRASVAGRSGTMSSAADRQLFHGLRTRVDAILVGAGTVRAERYGRIVRDPHRREQRVAAGLDADPLAIVVSGRLELPVDLPLLQDPDSRVIVVTAVQTKLEGCAATVQYLRGETVDLAAALARLRAEHGVRSILCEGGPSLNAALFAGGLADELFLTTVPTLAGAAGALAIIGDAPLDAPLGAELAWLLEHDGGLFARYRVGA